MVSAVVLAAGASTRMGSQKLLLLLGGEPLLRRSVRQVCDAGFDDVLVVLGSEHEQTRTALEGLAVRRAVNAEDASGMGGAFRTAAEHPFLSSVECVMVLDAYPQDPHGIVSVRYGEVMAPPHLFEREFFPEL